MHGLKVLSDMCWIVYCRLAGSLATERRVQSRGAYTAPILLKGVEYVDVWCGTNHNFLVHNWPNETKVAKLRVGGRRGMVL